MAVFLDLNDAEIDDTIDAQERIMLALASSSMRREELVVWLNSHVKGR
jgi:death-on-curing protein